MAHAFDTGAAAPQRTRLQDGAVALLSGLKKSAGGYLVEVVGFPFTMHPGVSEDDQAQFVTTLSRAPSIAIALGDQQDKPATVGGFAFEGEIEMHVYLSSNNARNPQVGRMRIDTAGLASDQADPGLHIVMEHVRELLIGQRAGAPGFDIKQIRPWRTVEVITAQAITIWDQIYKVTVMTQIDEFRTVTQILESLRFRATQAPNEAHRPNPATSTTTVDVNVDDL